MAKKQRPSFLKRQKEIARQQRQREKTARRLERKHERTGEGPPIEEAEPWPPPAEAGDPARD